MAIPLQAAITWLTGLGWNVTQESGAPLEPGPLILEMPDRLVTLSQAGGPGLMLESAADASLIQARVRGGQNDQPGAEQLALALDALIASASFPVVINGTKLIQCYRYGAPPSPLTGSPDDGDRYEYVCSYVFIAS